MTPKRLEIRKKTGEKGVIVLGVRPSPQSTSSQVTEPLGDDWEHVHMSLGRLVYQGPEASCHACSRGLPFGISPPPSRGSRATMVDVSWGSHKSFCKKNVWRVREEVSHLIPRSLERYMRTYRWRICILPEWGILGEDSLAWVGLRSILGAFTGEGHLKHLCQYKNILVK